MDLPTFIVEITKALAWPLAALGALLLHRREIRGLLQRVKRGKVAGAEFEFEDRVADLRGKMGSGEAEQAAVPPGLTKDAERDPRAVILNAWLEVQALVERVVALHATPEERRQPGSVSLHVLHRLLRDKPEYIDTYNDLRSLRHQAVHDTSFAPRPSSVVEYVSLTHELMAVLAPYAAPGSC